MITAVYSEWHFRLPIGLLKCLLPNASSISLPALADVTYTYTGNSFTDAGNTVTDSLTYSNLSRIEFSFTSPNELTGSTPLHPTVSSWNFSDGTQSFTSSDNISLWMFDVIPFLFQ